METRVFGPVPSRRLGKSLGVNNIPHKVCSYSCVYCQVGKAVKKQVERQAFYKPETLVQDVKEKLGHLSKEAYPDYISIVPDGEPTLDIHLGTLIEKLKVFEIPIAVITNASLINEPEVQQELALADYISVKADTIIYETWKKLNVPHKDLDLTGISYGISSFSRLYGGIFVTETMLVKGRNDSYEELEHTARMIESFKPQIAFISIPTRPTAVEKIEAADETTVNEAWHIFKDHVDQVELLTGYEGNAFASTGDAKNDLLSITAVHPMKEEAVDELLEKTGSNRKLLTWLIENGLLERVEYRGENFFVRKFTS